MLSGTLHHNDRRSRIKLTKIFRFDMAIEELMMYSLVAKRSDSAGKISLSIHTLVQQGFRNCVTRNWQHEYLIQASELLNHAFTLQAKAQPRASYGKECQIYTPHILELNARLQEYKPDSVRAQSFVVLSRWCAM